MISPREELLKSMRAVPVVVRAMTAGIDAERARRRPAEGEWAIVEVVAHMADVDKRAAERIERILSEEVPDLPGFDEAQLAIDRGYLDFPLDREVRRLETIVGELVARLEHLDDAGWRRIGRHSEHGLMSVELYIQHVAAEDVDHLAQIARLLPAS